MATGTHCPRAPVGINGRARVSIADPSEKYVERKKYLTAKYGAHQMKLIRKRLEVEGWVDTELRKLYDLKSDTDYDIPELDIDEVLDVDGNNERREYVQKRVADAKKSPEVINQFLDELLLKLVTL